MVSKIIQKEKERQEEYLHSGSDSYESGQIKSHKKSLINLKEYMDWNLRTLEHFSGDTIYKKHLQLTIIQIREDIKELTKMIDRYK